ncbi:MAG TPA: hypothetical protein PK239_00020 [Chitinophagales bacterium]|nr:hypothetical protein [Chitinophagales bacterium]
MYRRRVIFSDTSIAATRQGTFTQTLDLSGLPSGMYVWRLALPGGYEQHEASGKLVLE